MKKYSKRPWWFRESVNCTCFGCKLISTPYGKLRRQLILNFLAVSENGLAINRKNQPQISKDPDLRKLLKKGKIRTSISCDRVFKV